MTMVFLFIKHNFPFIWGVADWLNSIIFELLYYSRFKVESERVLSTIQFSNYIFRKIEEDDLINLSNLILNQGKNRLEFFKPHGFDSRELKKMLKLKSFLMMGVFDGDQIVGYFFLRCFFNKQCFVGRLIDEKYEGKGIGRCMNDIMYNIGWDANFHVMSTISKNNKWVMRSHANNNTMKVIKELDNNFLLVEFLKH